MGNFRLSAVAISHIEASQLVPVIAFEGRELQIIYCVCRLRPADCLGAGFVHAKLPRSGKKICRHEDAIAREFQPAGVVPASFFALVVRSATSIRPGYDS